MSSTAKSTSGGGREAGPLSPLLHGRVRLLVLSHLLKAAAPVTFTDLRRQLALTDGTLSVHLAKLVDGGVVELERRFVGKRPQTRVRMTDQGRTMFAAYLRELREVLPEF